MSEDIRRGLVNYTSRDYQSLLKEYKELVPMLTELWRPDAEADPGVVLLKILASTADMLGINQDIMTTEMFGPTVKQRKNAEKIFGLIGYQLGWYRAARTEITFSNVSETDNVIIDFGFNGANFCTMNAYSDISDVSRVITYNILPLTSTYGASESKSRRSVITDNLDVFAESDKVRLRPGESVTRVAIEGELRSYSISVDQVKKNNYIIKLPSQHIDTTAVWVKAKTSASAEKFQPEQFIQVTSPSEFITPEPRFSVTYDSYSNAQVQISNYLNQLEDYDNNWLTIYWIDCSGAIGCVGEDVLTNFLAAKPGQTFDEASLAITNLSNTLELPNTHTVTGRSPETAREAYINSRNYINTFDSLVTLPDFNRFLKRESGVDTGLVIDCQKAMEINLAIYNDENLTPSQKSKQYITNQDFPAGEPIYDWESVLGLGFDPNDPNKFVFSTNFKTYTAMCFAIHNDFKDSSWGRGTTAVAEVRKGKKFDRYKPPAMFIDAVKRDYAPLQAMSVELEFGYIRVFNFRIVGTIRTIKPVSKDVAANIIRKVKEDLKFYFSPGNRELGQKPVLSEIIDVIEDADERIRHFDPGALRTQPILWHQCDEDYFNAISFARYMTDDSSVDIRIAPECIVDV